jgi:hypothetical protein
MLVQITNYQRVISDLEQTKAAKKKKSDEK